MATKKKMLQAAAGQAGGAGLDITDVFSTYLYEGQSTTLAVNNGIDLATEDGLTWIKCRNAAEDHFLFSSLQNASNQTLFLKSNTTNAATATNNVSQTSTGFSLPGGDGQINQTGNDYASWTFRKAPKFFTMVTWTGDGSDTREVSHNLGSKPGMIAIKSTSTSNNWVVWHRGATGSTGTINGSLTEGAKVRNAILNLNTTGALASLDNSIKAPSSTTLYFGDRNNTTEDVNVSGREYVAYLFAHNDGDGGFGPSGDQDIIKCGSYTGNSGGAINVELGFEPQWLMIKNATSGSNWVVLDTMRGFSWDAGNNLVVNANADHAEQDVDENGAPRPTSTGFSLASSGQYGEYNFGTNTYIYMAIRRGPLAQPESGTEVFAPVFHNDDTSEINVSGGFTADAFISKRRSGTDTYMTPRLLGGQTLRPSSTAGEVGYSNFVAWDTQEGVNFTGWWGAVNDGIDWQFKRAPGFCDVVAYTGDGVAGRTVSHNLGVAPEMIWVKSREQARSWNAYLGPLGLSGGAPAYAVLNETDAAAYSTTRFYTTPTATEFSVGSNSRVNTSGEDYIAYLFATVPGVSKVGSYTGDGTTDGSKVIDCGFTSGARFVLIKRSNSGGSWYVWDTVRGIVAGNDARLALNSSDEEASFDNVDPHSSGFSVVGSSINNINGGEYIFYAIA